MFTLKVSVLGEEDDEAKYLVYAYVGFILILCLMVSIGIMFVINDSNSKRQKFSPKTSEVQKKASLKTVLFLLPNFC